MMMMMTRGRGSAKWSWQSAVLKRERGKREQHGAQERRRRRADEETLFWARQSALRGATSNERREGDGYGNHTF